MFHACKVDFEHNSNKKLAGLRFGARSRHPQTFFDWPNNICIRLKEKKYISIISGIYRCCIRTIKTFGTGVSDYRLYVLGSIQAKQNDRRSTVFEDVWRAVSKFGKKQSCTRRNINVAVARKQLKRKHKHLFNPLLTFESSPINLCSSSSFGTRTGFFSHTLIISCIVSLRSDHLAEFKLE